MGYNKLQLKIEGGIMRKRLTRSRRDRIIFGVCGGIANYFDIDPVIVRIAFILFGVTLFFYIIMAIIIPNEDEDDVY